MEFEWDAAKDEANCRKHGFDFTYAIRIFDGPVRHLASRRDRGEQRMIATGQVEGRFISLVYTRRNGRYRIISARPARRNERF
jgi:hypothetical protein